MANMCSNKLVFNYEDTPKLLASLGVSAERVAQLIEHGNGPVDEINMVASMFPDDEFSNKWPLTCLPKTYDLAYIVAENHPIGIDALGSERIELPGLGEVIINMDDVDFDTQTVPKVYKDFKTAAKEHSESEFLQAMLNPDEVAGRPYAFDVHFWADTQEGRCSLEFETKWVSPEEWAYSMSEQYGGIQFYGEEIGNDYEFTIDNYEE